MKTVLNLRVEESRHQKLRDVARKRKKTMTQLVEDWIDRLPNPSKEISVAEAATWEPLLHPTAKADGL